MNGFDRVAGYKINAQKFIAVLYTNEKRWERKINEITPFTTTTKIIKYLKINLWRPTRLFRTNTQTNMLFSL